MSNRSSIIGFGSLEKKMLSLSDSVTLEIKKVVARRALEVETDAKRSVQGGGKTGKTYKRSEIKRGRGKNRKVVGYKFHRASAPGEAPATDTGRLVSNISTLVALDGMEAEIGVFGKIVDDEGEARNYARDLEFGTTKMAARPFLQPALEKNKEKIVRTVNDAIKRALKNVSDS